MGYTIKGRCSCGLPFVECPVWTRSCPRPTAPLTPSMPTRWSPAPPLRLEVLAPDGDRRDATPAAHAPRLVPRDGEALYEAIRAVTGCNVIVDSSKEPHYSYILNSRPGLDVYVLHLVRDPRAVGFSWSKRREQKGIPGSMMEVRPPAVSATYYGVSNLATEVMWARREGRYLRVRYEDFVLRRSRSWIASVRSWASPSTCVPSCRTGTAASSRERTAPGAIRTGSHRPRRAASGRRMDPKDERPLPPCHHGVERALHRTIRLSAQASLDSIAGLARRAEARHAHQDRDDGRHARARDPGTDRAVHAGRGTATSAMPRMETASVAVIVTVPTWSWQTRARPMAMAVTAHGMPPRTSHGRICPASAYSGPYNMGRSRCTRNVPAAATTISPRPSRIAVSVWRSSIPSVRLPSVRAPDRSSQEG